MDAEDAKEEIYRSEDFSDVSDDEDNEENKLQSIQEIPSGAGSSSAVIEEQIIPSKSFQVWGGQLYDPASLQSSSSSMVRSNAQKNRMPERIIDSSADTNVNAKFESPLQKYQRIKREISEYQHELQTIVEQSSKESVDPTRTITQQLSKDLNTLFSSVEDFKSNPQLAQLFLQSNNTMLETVDSNFLFQRLAAFQASKQGNTAAAAASDNSRAVFTLYHDGNVKNKTYRMKEIEERVSLMETILGPAPENPSVGPMMRSVEFLAKRLELLSDSTKLHGLERRAEVLKKKLLEISQKQHSTMDIQITKQKEEKINQLFEMMCRWDEAALQLPTVVRRLQSVANLHEESANIVNKVDELEIQNKLIAQTLQSNQQTLSKLHANLVDNNQIVLSNLKSFEDRIQSLQQKITSLK